jgi:hypothetical protein
MKNRDQFVNDLKARLDRWNLEAEKWEARGGRLRADQAKAFHARRDEALYQLRLLEMASSAAFDDAAAGAEKAWKALAEAFEKAYTHFEKAPQKKKA